MVVKYKIIWKSLQFLWSGTLSKVDVKIYVGFSPVEDSHPSILDCSRVFQFSAYWCTEPGEDIKYLKY